MNYDRLNVERGVLKHGLFFFFFFLPMKYFYKSKQTYNITHGEIYVCDHKDI